MKTVRSYRRRDTIAIYRAPAGKYLRPANNLHYHPETEIQWMETGWQKIQLEETVLDFAEGEFLIIPGNTPHRCADCSENAMMRSILFSPEAIRLPEQHFFQQNFTAPLAEGRLEMPQFLRKGHPAYEAVLQQMQLAETARIYEKDYKLVRFSMLMNICFALMPHCREISTIPPDLTPPNEIVKLCKRYIINHYRQKIYLRAIAEICHTHPTHLCAVFKAQTGKTVFEYLNSYRIQVAAQLLVKENLPVSRAAELAGFRTESLFYQKFKAITGMTPKAYQKQQMQRK